MVALENVWLLGEQLEIVGPTPQFKLRHNIEVAGSRMALEWEPQTRNPKNIAGTTKEYTDPGRYIPIIFLLYSWGSLFWGSNLHPSKFTPKTSIAMTYWCLSKDVIVSTKA